MRIRQIDEAMVCNRKRMREEQFNPADKITVDVPLLLRIMEFAKEDAKTDMDLHHVLENLIELSSQEETLSMQHYDQIVNIPR